MAQLIEFKDLQEATFSKRYKRFLVDAVLPSGDTVVAHCANTGSMKGLLNEGARCWLAPQQGGKLNWKLELLEVAGAIVGVNTARPNAYVEHLIQAGEIPELVGYAALKREVKYGQNSRIDILLQAEDQPDCYVEIKNTTLRVGTAAQFPDAMTERGRKHLRELQAMVDTGKRAVMVYYVNREDCQYFSPADDIDAAYGTALREAINNGVEALAYAVTNTPTGVTTIKKLPINL